MKPILKIAKNELRHLFYSPVAWLQGGIFQVMCAYFYTGIIYPQAKGFYMVLRNNPSWIYRASLSATHTIFAPFFSNVLPNLYLFVPILTMGIMNREFNQGTIRLLYSSPVKLRQIVIGKYLALLLFNLTFIGIMAIFMISGYFDILSLDTGLLFSAILGIWLFLCALTAIGFFMSSLTHYQIVAAIATFTMLFILMSIGGLWQQIDFVRDLTWFLSIRNRTERMVEGLIRSQDILYYLVIIFLCVGFTLIRLRAGRESRAWYIQAARYLAVAVTGLAIGYIGSLPRLTAYRDTTRRKTNTLHPRTLEILQQLKEGPLVVTMYTNLLDLSSSAKAGFPAARNTFLENWDPYVRFKPDIQFRFVYYYAVAPGDSSFYKKFPGKTLKQIAGLMAKGFQVDPTLFKSPEELHLPDNLRKEGYYTTMQMQYQGRTSMLRYLPVFTGADFGEGSTEQNINAALKRIAGAKMPHVAFISGELERSIYKMGEREYGRETLGKGPLNDYTTIGSLTNQGFDIDTLNLSTGSISPEISIVVMTDPRMDLTPNVLNKLKAYIRHGGNMLIFGEPGKQPVLNPLLLQLGIQLTSGQLVQPSRNETPDKIQGWITDPGLNLSEEHWLLRYKNLREHGILTDTLGSSMIGATALSNTADSGFQVRPISMTTPGSSWLKKGRLVTDSTVPVFSPQLGDLKGTSFPTILQLTRQTGQKEQRVVVCGDADIASNYNYSGNGDLIRSIYSWLQYNQLPIYTPFPHASDNLVILQPGWAAGQKIVYIWVLPGLILFAGTVLLVRRMRK